MHGAISEPPPVPNNQPEQNEQPVAIANADVTEGKAVLVVNFIGEDSSDPDGTIVTYQ